jgi:hypothetical protein
MTQLLEQKRKLNHRIERLCDAIDHDLHEVFLKYFESNSYAYFALEEKLVVMKALFETIQRQGMETTTLADLSKVIERAGYVEDRMDEIESQIYNRRKRRVHRFNFSDFFKKYQEQIGYDAESDIPSMQEAYQILGLAEGTGMLEVTAAFRRFAKKYHPDARGGDRSQETELRRVVGAYEYIKRHFAGSV